MRFRANRSWYSFPAWNNGEFFQGGVDGMPPAIFEGTLIDEQEDTVTIRVTAAIEHPLGPETFTGELVWEWLKEVLEVVEP